MSAIDPRAALAAFTALALCLPGAVLAQDGPAPAKKKKIEVDFSLSQQSAPGAKPWEQPALLSYTIDRDGPDFYNVELNADLDIGVYKAPAQGTEFSIGPSISYAGSNAKSSRQDNLAAGLTAKYRTISASGEAGLRALAGLDYAREGIFPDRGKAPCDTDTTSVFCRKQHAESLKASLDLYPFLRWFEGSANESPPFKGRHNRSLSWSFSPRIQIAHDDILDGAVDASTGAKVTGGVTSVLAGAGLKLTPGFINPPFEVNLTGTVRQRLSASSRRTDLTDKTEARMQLSATYFVAQSEDSGWRAGFSVIWTEGGDSFVDKPKESTIVLAFRIGHF
ncbi:hypothetical protein JMG10_31925 [Nostoc ellipsosporum NOK]|nr:hypothetical protein [Nostoc ellipsosporum NOK]